MLQVGERNEGFKNYRLPEVIEKPVKATSLRDRLTVFSNYCGIVRTSHNPHPQFPTPYHHSKKHSAVTLDYTWENCKRQTLSWEQDKENT